MTLLAESDLETLRQQLLKNPSFIEPGLLLKAESLVLPNDTLIPMHGTDMLGRPCLVGVFQRLDAEAYYWAIEAAIAFRDGLHGSDPIYSCGREPRIFLLCTTLSSSDHARLRLLGNAVSVRVYKTEPRPTLVIEGSSVWHLELAFPAPDQPSHRNPWWLEVDEEHKSCISRLLAAANRGDPKISILGQPWPLLFSGPSGLFAALHKSERGLVMVVEGSEVSFPQVLDLNLESEQDLAVDCVLRNRIAKPKIFVTN